MKLELFNTTDTKETINKTLTLIDTLDINLKANTNILNPNLLLTRKENINYESINFAKMDDRYYNVTRAEFPNRSFIRFILNEDVLETYKNDILNSQAEIVRKSTPSYNAQALDSDSRHEQFTYKSNKDFSNQESTILVTIGGQ